MPKLNKVPDFVEEAIHQKRKWVSLTGLCNNNCVFCLDGDRKDRHLKEESEIAGQIREGRKEGAEKLVLSGGEPTIHPGLPGFVRLGKELGYGKIQIVSNGRMLGYRKFARALREAGLDETTFSIHGHTRKMHEDLTRVPGSFSQIVSGIRNALREGFIVNTDTVITQRNYRKLPEIIRFVNGLGVTEVNLMSIVPYGNAWRNRETVLYDFGKATPFVRKVIEYCESRGMVLWLSRYPAEYLEGHEKYIESYRKIAEDVVAIGREHFLKRECRGERCVFCGVQSVCENIQRALKGELEKPGKMVDLWDFMERNPPVSITQAIGEIEESLVKDKKAKLVGVPLCMVSESLQNRVAGVTQPGSGKGFEEMVDEICRMDMVKPVSCRECGLYRDCPGIYREYARMFGFGELKPWRLNGTR